jgi:hypothetical protein
MDFLIQGCVSKWQGQAVAFHSNLYTLHNIRDLTEICYIRNVGLLQRLRGKR